MAALASSPPGLISSNAELARGRHHKASMIFYTAVKYATQLLKYSTLSLENFWLISPGGMMRRQPHCRLASCAVRQNSASEPAGDEEQPLSNSRRNRRMSTRMRRRSKAPPLVPFRPCRAYRPPRSPLAARFRRPGRSADVCMMGERRAPGDLEALITLIANGRVA
jgi:hypothetical protein